MFERFTYRNVKMSNKTVFRISVHDIRRLKMDQIEFGRSFIAQHRWPCKGYYYRIAPNRVIVLIGVSSNDAIDSAKKGGQLTDISIA